MLQIDGSRLWGTIMEMAKIGGTQDGGVCRLAFTELDRLARNQFAGWARMDGFEVAVDRAGNLFIRRPGTRNDLPPVLIGSHLDTQPTGGKFDGIYGVLAGLEVLRSLNAAGVRTLRPVEVVDWTAEEGVTFKPMLGSRIFTGALPLDEAYSLTDPDGRTLKESLEAIQYLGDRPFFPANVHAYFELHIEQGPVLEHQGRQIGAVTGAVGQRWYDLVIRGQETHAGPCPMSLRRDALMGAAEIALLARQIASADSDGRATVGMLSVSPGSRNVVPGKIEMTVDLRHPDAGLLSKFDQQFRSASADLAARCRLEIEITERVQIPAIRFHPLLVERVRSAARSMGANYADIVSGAGHDACNLALALPTTMIFIPCKDGLSHNAAESATPEDVAMGCCVLAQAVLATANDAFALEPKAA